MVTTNKKIQCQRANEDLSKKSTNLAFNVLKRSELKLQSNSLSRLAGLKDMFDKFVLWLSAPLVTHEAMDTDWPEKQTTAHIQMFLFGARILYPLGYCYTFNQFFVVLACN